MQLTINNDSVADFSYDFFGEVKIFKDNNYKIWDKLSGIINILNFKDTINRSLFLAIHNSKRKFDSQLCLSQPRLLSALF